VSGGSAYDSVIARLVAEGGAGAVVVSSDREVGDAARRRGAAWLSAAEFQARVEASRLVSLKGTDEEERPAKKGKGVARRLPKAARRRERRLRGL
jgi:predicted RNA-binding protein with PIN domain